MCLVEIEKSPKPITGCAMPISPNMKIYTDTPLVKKAREGLLELLLLNHPLDCPICDQGGECDLQDQLMVFGSDKTRFYEKKRKVEDKNFNPLIKTIMTRCIHCTRCVRFAFEIGGAEEGSLGTVNRGQQTEISTYIDQSITNELSGNVIDLCPVGALTSKPYAFNGRPWELKSVESIDIFDALGTFIRIDYKESKIIRILPKYNQNFTNQEFITDKIRFCYDGIFNNRLSKPLEKNSNNLFKIVSWDYIIRKLLILLHSNNPKKICFILGNNLDSESILSSKLLVNNFGISKIITDRFIKLSNTFSSNYTFNRNSINKTDFLYFIGTNPRVEGPLLNLQIQRNVVTKNILNFSTGFVYNSTYKSINYISLNISNFIKILEGIKLYSFNFKIAKYPLLINGTGLLERIDFIKFISTLYFYNNKVKLFNSNSVNTLISDSNFVGNNNIGIHYFFPELFNSIKILYSIHPTKEILNYITSYMNFNSEKILLNNNKSNFNLYYNKPLTIYQGSHFPILNKDLINYCIPGKTFVEKEGRFFNIENKCQKTSKMIFNLSNFQNREDSQILQVLNNNYKNFDNKFLQLIPLNLDIESNFKNLYFFKNVKLIKSILKPIIVDFYSNNEITFNSIIMSKVSRLFRENKKSFFLVKRHYSQLLKYPIFTK